MIKMYYMSFFGILLLLGSAVFLCKSAYSYYDRTLEYYREVLSFLYTVKQKISTSSTKITVILHDMDNLKLLCECGFIKKAGEQGCIRRICHARTNLCLTLRTRTSCADTLPIWEKICFVPRLKISADALLSSRQNIKRSCNRHRLRKK